MLESEEIKRIEKKNIRILDEIKKEIGNLPPVKKNKANANWDEIF